tara:strand:+ start:52 stop:759 length:708 start_codon:yes stop_codon:yes gene_type:complete
MGFTRCLMVSRMKELDLFDNISYKDIKDIINNDGYNVDVEIEGLHLDGIAYCKTQFTFEININVSGGCMPVMVDKKFVVEKEYNTSSAYLLMMLELIKEDEEEEEEEEEDEEDESEDEEWDIEIQVVGFGFCRYKTMEDVKRETTLCKNTLYKMKGDKTAYDMEGNYCETEDESEDESEKEEEDTLERDDLEKLQSDFWENMADVFGTDIIDSDSHPLKEAFKLYCKIKAESEEN